MTPLDVLAWLAGGGFTVEVREGRLWVSPASQLTEADRALLAGHRDALVAYLSGPPARAEPPRGRWEPDAQRELFEGDDLAWR